MKLNEFIWMIVLTVLKYYHDLNTFLNSPPWDLQIGHYLLSLTEHFSHTARW